MDIEKWSEDNNLNIEWISKTLARVGGEKYLFIDKKDKIIDEDFELFADPIHYKTLERNPDCEKVIYYFGGVWYWTPAEGEVQLNPLLYIGEPAGIIEETNIAHLGVHGGYELCNAVGMYDQWCSKAKFLKYKYLGICEYHTLAGTLRFQEECKSNDLTPIIGETVDVFYNDNKNSFRAKLYVQNDEGWRNLTHINFIINSKETDKGITLQELKEFNEGIICVCGSGIDFSKQGPVKEIKSIFEHCYYQLHFTEYSSNNTDVRFLKTINNYLKNHVKDLPPILLQDAYYVEEQWSEAKEILRKIGKPIPMATSQDQYFKSMCQIIDQGIGLCKDPSSNKLFSTIDFALSNLYHVAKICGDFRIETGVFHLPSYILTEKESQNHVDSEELFYSLITDALKEKGFGDDDRYLDRIEKELEVIIKGGFIDYFLILRDIINYAESNDILVGIGRGSAGGSLISYLLGIIKINPLEYNLLFERFLNESRIKNSLPDIDVDFEGNRRSDIKKYVESRYGRDKVASIGTYSTFKIRACVDSLLRLKGINPNTVSYYTAMIDPNFSPQEFFKYAATHKTLRRVLRENADVLRFIPAIYKQPKNSSIHAAGLIITPQHEGEIYRQLPVKVMGDDLMVTEYEGEELEKSGYLKEDILGIKQLEKFRRILDLIKENHGEEIDIYSLPLDDLSVYEKFQEGLNEDVFQFGAEGLKNYCSELKPENINDLIAAVALYRPGPIEANIHKAYVEIKNGKRSVEYDHPSLEEITLETGGLYIYQEQIMQVCQIIADFSLSEADDVRKAMGKKKEGLLDSYKSTFLERAKAKGIDKFLAIKIWNKIEGFAGYAFNKSHATAYAITAYICQWLKVHYPLEFWTVSLNYAGNSIENRLSELSHEKQIKMLPPDINHTSTHGFSFSKEKNHIYWGLSEIKGIGGKAMESLVEITKKEVFSLKEFIQRCEPKEVKVNKSHIVKLILSGAFDNLKAKQDIYNRIQLLKEYGKIIGDFPYVYDMVRDNYNLYLDKQIQSWDLQLAQKKICNFSLINYSSIPIKISSKFSEITIQNRNLSSSIGKYKYVSGIVTSITEKNSVKGKFGEVILEKNFTYFHIVMWFEIWGQFKDIVEQSEGEIIMVSGEWKHDNWRNQKVLQTDRYSEIKVLSKK